MLTLWYRDVIVAKKNNKRIMRKPNGQPFIASSKQAKAQEQVMAYEFMAQAKTQGWQADDKAAYYVEIYITEPDKHRRDLDNQATAILDALVAAGILPDDDNRHMQHLSVELKGYDKYDPHAYILVDKIANYIS